MGTKNSSKTLRASTKQRKLSHIAKMREKFASNQVFILTKVGLSEVDYENQFLEAGCQFLEVVYGEGSIWYEELAYSSACDFWKWFKAEFKILENGFINVLNCGEENLKVEDWNDFIVGIPHDQFLEKSLVQFLKTMPNVKI
jgi:hypothetical protein